MKLIPVKELTTGTQIKCRDGSKAIVKEITRHGTTDIKVSMYGKLAEVHDENFRVVAIPLVKTWRKPPSYQQHRYHRQ
jgi:hypothetical protein